VRPPESVCVSSDKPKRRRCGQWWLRCCEERAIVLMLSALGKCGGRRLQVTKIAMRLAIIVIPTHFCVYAAREWNKPLRFGSPVPSNISPIVAREAPPPIHSRSPLSGLAASGSGRKQGVGATVSGPALAGRAFFYHSIDHTRPEADRSSWRGFARPFYHFLLPGILSSRL